MQIKNVIIVAATLFSLSTVANAESVSFGFNSTSSASVNQLNQVNVSNAALTKAQEESVSLGFNSVAETTVEKVKVSAKQLVNVKKKATVSKGFSLGANS